MAISRLGQTAITVSGLAALAGLVIWFGILKREDRPGSVSREAAVQRAPADVPAASQGAQTAPPPGQAEGQVVRAPDPSATPTSPSAAPPPATPADAPAAAPPRPSATPPSFDIVRVEPSGESVIAGRTAPGATVELLRNGKSHARIASDASGLFAFVPPPFPPGSHEIVLQATAPDGTRMQSRESVTIAIAEKKDAKPLVALATPDRPTVVLSEPEPAAAPSQPAPRPPEPPTRMAAAPDPAKVEQPKPPAAAPAALPPAAPQSPPSSAAAPPSPPQAAPPPQPGAPRAAAAPPPAAPSAAAPSPTAPAAPRPRPNVRIASVEAEEGGRLFVSGQAAPGATVRLYLNETMIAPGGAGMDGRVSFAIGRGVRPGSYRVRLDDVDPVSGEVKSRAEVEFRVPASVMVELPPPAQPYVTSAPPVASGPASPPAERAPGRVASAPAAPAAPARSTEAPAASTFTSPPPASTGTPPSAPPSPGHATSPPPAPATVLVPEVNTAIVSRGDSLWRISRRIYGSGTRYTVIYDANEAQIRNRHLIYPGQVFVLPPENEGEARP
jgi:nucleoid-associated protein YgaU